MLSENILRSGFQTGELMARICNGEITREDSICVEALAYQHRGGNFAKLSANCTLAVPGDGSHQLHVNCTSAAIRSANYISPDSTSQRKGVDAAMAIEPLVLQNEH